MRCERGAARAPRYTFVSAGEPQPISDVAAAEREAAGPPEPGNCRWVLLSQVEHHLARPAIAEIADEEVAIVPADYSERIGQLCIDRIAAVP